MDPRSITQCLTTVGLENHGTVGTCGPGELSKRATQQAGQVEIQAKQTGHQLDGLATTGWACRLVVMPARGGGRPLAASAAGRTRASRTRTASGCPSARSGLPHATPPAPVAQPAPRDATTVTGSVHAPMSLPSEVGGLDTSTSRPSFSIITLFTCVCKPAESSTSQSKHTGTPLGNQPSHFWMTWLSKPVTW
jgi:hypothetical protein